MNETKLTLDLFKSNGYHVDVWHLRRYKVTWPDRATGKIRVEYKEFVMHDRDMVFSRGAANAYFELLPSGGTTIVSVIDLKTGDEFEGVAHCRKDDNFNKKTGVQVALRQIVNLMLVEPGYQVPWVLVEAGE